MKCTRILSALGAVAGIALAQAPADAAEAKLSAVSFIRLDIDWGIAFAEYVQDVNKQCDGLVRIDIRGGPEVMNPFEQPTGLKSGVFDMLLTIPAFFQGQFPGALAFNLAQKTPEQQRKNRFYDYVNEKLAQSLNARMLVNTTYGVKFHLYLAKKPIEKADLTGLKLRSLPIYRPLFEKLGATAVTMNQSELFTALETGAVDGYGYISWGVKEQGWAPVTKYRVDPGFYTVSTVYLINTNAWSKLSQEAKDCLNKISIEIEKKHEVYIKEQTPKEYERQAKSGIQTVKLPPAEAEKMLKTAVEVGWADVKQKAPGDYEKLRSLLE
jgi:TRAP-type C4-dicarboxylate transport system substrate-binding protein